MAEHTIKQMAALLAPYAENGESAVVSKLKDFKDSPCLPCCRSLCRIGREEPEVRSRPLSRSTIDAWTSGQ